MCFSWNPDADLADRFYTGSFISSAFMTALWIPPLTHRNSFPNEQLIEWHMQVLLL